ncbi:TPA: UDP-N-acetylmuramoyl-L-alanyl-D-glutamate--2,6-diaminopimelate ligase [Vibrio parahaemolyticus]|uniref:UDP-N-acetylmuramoyl-L-alanyl-D-glutamate--2, 6-diaminopimelate ligase n=1 Tax=Vibrio parahaemolyticus TaxID=670 RepID=UPI00041F76B1|nr:UDP-N-acetylmuramoyl-L-alanyl-D-glutamate--2,6-diaminopimelate ligase [Vibrio parahaemolyticus]EGR1750085.1 UDP-N-acetylmuramoyl-L-alanyl-D-glutamate--2,6-diaminopimelate ligase [Vibrio parahaemolyticus]EME0903098.1 UDP-N-acetylmuramoyl-L-alanyl-D-glutamate--2,6-diaminopimelate ligase [Vibrio parahaemolyticus]MBE5153878.1 UDP-N-acetylmuramoyl-L-alanyl-D-glutamate--2,6-diaminopimelate ligase [Vibrio parahaemolyticus]MBE5163165.1 UDP-N-acetylmuramoyl-L-alanyl-D-glutamate--2,6-diaminopimelate l
MTKAISMDALLSPWADCPSLASVLVSELELDSRKVQPGTTFVALVGHVVDGRKFIASAIEKGANAVIAQACDVKAHGTIDIIDDIPVVYLDALDKCLSEIAGQLYTYPDMKLIGVTGTNGKTTITQLIAQWIGLVGSKAAVMGTTGNGFLDDLKEAANTTGNAVEIQHTLASLAEQQAQYTALEVSSHGLIQGRVKSLSFAAGVFTNLSRDHLDYHGTMEEYANAKLTLFTQHQCDQAIINVDDEVGAAWAKQLTNAIAVSLAPTTEFEHALWASQVAYAESGITIRFDGQFGEGTLHAPLIGEFNAANLMLAFATLLSLGFDKSDLLATAAQLQPVLGRMELFQAEHRAKVVVDYAHTPDALEKALQALRVHCDGQLWAIFGCGGDRDAGKRPMMAEIAERLGDKVVLTDDNPRSEDPVLIVKDMLAGLSKPAEAIVQHDRFKALSYALENAAPQDIILLAGKGHEDYQIRNGETIHYSDRESAMQLLGLSS